MPSCKPSAKRPCRITLLLILLTLQAACTTLPPPEARLAQARQLAQAQHWQAQQLATSPFALTAFLPQGHGQTQRLSVYIEGDGLAWLSPTTPARDPSPSDPTALRLALAQPEGQAAYLARPCQYRLSSQPNCQTPLWTGARFSEAVITASDQALDQLKQHYGAEQLILIGYSGGAAVAALLAMRRDDVALLVSVAGNLDHRRWTAHHRITPLHGSLNPADDPDALAALPQRHLVGARDSVIPPTLFQHLPNETVHIEGPFDHHCCWAEHWPRLWQTHIAPLLQ